MNDKHRANLPLRDAVIRLCEQAGERILEVYHASEGIEVDRKSDDSPLTAADLAAHEVLHEGLQQLLPEVPVLSEEGHIAPWEQRRHWQRYWIIDPLDGTKEFIKRSGEFTVNVALVENGQAVLGVVYVPVQGISYSGIAATGAWRRDASGEKPISVRSARDQLAQGQALALVASRSHGAAEVQQLMERLRKDLGARVETTNMGSSLKLCLVAEGKADLYPRLAPTCEWDTAAAQAVVEAAGGEVWTEDLEVMAYNRKESLLNPFFYVVGDTAFPWKSLLTS